MRERRLGCKEAYEGEEEDMAGIKEEEKAPKGIVANEYTSHLHKEDL